MQRQKRLLCRFLLLFVVAIVQGTGNVGGAVTTPFITYTCNAHKITDITISNNDAAHVKVFKHDGGYCEPSGKTKAGVLQCIKTFVEKNADKTDRIDKVTLVYEDETKEGIVGGINTKYFLLSCDELATNKTASMNTINFMTTTPSSPSTLHADISETPSLHVVNHPSHDYYIGEHITLEMTVSAKYKLLPQACTAYQSETGKGNSYMFWQRCTNTDVAIVPANANEWTLANTQSTLHLDMYAFRFVDSGKLIIQCWTTVCLIGDTKSCNMGCPKRKRRSNPKESTNVTSATVSIALEVLDRRQFPDNGSQGLSSVWYLYTSGFGMIYWMTWKKL